MIFKWLDIRLARLGFVVAWIGVTALALMPARDVTVSLGWDKLNHWTAFFTLAFLAAHSFPRQSFWRIALGLVIYGIGIEIVQGFTGRDADVMDVVADSIGIIAYWLILLVYGVCVRVLPRAES